MKKTYNFSAGPAVLPRKVLEVVQHELLNYKGSGMSVMELSHRSSLYQDIHNETKHLLKSLLNLNDDFEILFIQGGASLQFTMIPLNFAKDKIGYYIDGGTWGKRAIEEANIINPKHTVCLASGESSNYTKIPATPEIPNDGAYLHITTNNTIEGTTLYELPQTNLPLIADMSSNILSVDYDYNQFDLIYAGAQKNLGPAGVCVVAVKNQLLQTINHTLPSMLDYRVYKDNDSLFNTPPTFSIYMLREVLKWVKDLGGVKAMEKRAKQKANLLYDTLDQSKLFDTPVKGKDRSLNNIPFYTQSDALNKRFLKEAEALGLLNLKGHRLVGGMRASIYNAMPLEGVKALCDFINTFEKEHLHAQD